MVLQNTTRPKVGLMGRLLHPMFLGPLLEHIDPTQVEIVLITNDPRASHIWPGDIVSMPEGQFSHTLSTLKNLSLDVLIEMTGQYPELQIMAERVAPIQGSWICTNLSQGPQVSDFVLADHYLIPLSDRDYWTEAILRLPIWAPFKFYQDSPRNETPTFLRKGHITFGACQRAMKFNVQTLVIWAEILNGTPGSELVVKDKSFSEGAARDAFKRRCRYAGLDEERLIFEAATPHPEYYDYYNRIDISLDTFPYGGGILTAESLWMGVPVVTLSGDRFNSRLAESYLEAIGRSEWVTKTPENYVKTAIELARSKDILETFRRTSRNELQNSAIMNYPAFAQAWTKHIHSMLKSKT